MKIEVKTYQKTLCEIKVESNNTIIEESLQYFNRYTQQYLADEDLPEELITAAFEISRFNKKSDVDLVREIIESFLNDSERDLLISYYK